MKRINIDKEKLIELLTPFARLANAKSINPILKGVLIEFKKNMITAVASDDDLAIRNTVFPEHTLEEAKILVDLKLFQEIIKKIVNKEIILEIKDSTIQIKQLKSNYKLALLNAEDYPPIEFINHLENSVNCEEFIKSFNFVSHCIATETSRFSLTGVHINCEKRWVGASDSYRLAIYDTPLIKGIDEVIISPKLINEIKQFDSDDLIHYQSRDNRFFMRCGQIEIASKLIEGKYPNLKNFIPTENKANFTIYIGQMLQALERMNLFKIDKVATIEMSNIDQNLKLETDKEEIGDCFEEIQCIDYHGDNISLCFNADYMIQALKKLYDLTDRINIEISEKNLILMKYENLTQVIVPILSLRKR